MANFRLPTATRNALADLIDDLINGGASGGLIRIYDGTQPASANDAITTQTLLAELTFGDPAFGAASVGVITANSITGDSSANATGTATWARIVDSNGTTIFDCDVGTSGATINLNSVSLVTGAPVSITSFTITVPAS
jgi:hypothetical protein